MVQSVRFGQFQPICPHQQNGKKVEDYTAYQKRIRQLRETDNGIVQNPLWERNDNMYYRATGLHKEVLEAFTLHQDSDFKSSPLVQKLQALGVSRQDLVPIYEALENVYSEIFRVLQKHPTDPINSNP